MNYMYRLCKKKRNKAFTEPLSNFDLIFWFDDNRQETDFCTVCPSSFDCHTTKMSGPLRFHGLSYGPFPTRPAFLPTSENRPLKIYLKSDFYEIGVSVKPMTHWLCDFKCTQKCLREQDIKGSWNFVAFFIHTNTREDAPNDVIGMVEAGRRVQQVAQALNVHADRSPVFEWRHSGHLLLCCCEETKQQNFSAILYPVPANIFACNWSHLINVSWASRRHQFHKNPTSGKFLVVDFLRDLKMLVSWEKGHNSVRENIRGLKFSWCDSLRPMDTQYKNQFPVDCHQTRILNQSLTVVL